MTPVTTTAHTHPRKLSVCTYVPRVLWEKDIYNLLLLNKLKYSSTREDHVCNSSGLKIRFVMIYEILLIVSRLSFFLETC